MEITRRESLIGLSGLVAGAYVGAEVMQYYDGKIIRKLEEGIVKHVLGELGIQEESPNKPGSSPDFELTGLDKKTYRLSDYRGKPVILNFWESWCGYCIDEIPTIQEFAKLYGDKLQVLTLTQDQKGGARKVAEKFGLILPILLDRGDKVGMAYGREGVPNTVLIDQEGKLVGGLKGATDFMNPRGEIRYNVDQLLPENQIPRSRPEDYKRGNPFEKPSYETLPIPFHFIGSFLSVELDCFDAFEA